ncbi:uncharacterized protein LOC110989451 [Acanthaster planci]|uniref:Uncharacterized protein LOC110989451 n=1 Tax=Acanthaster planci TaxID=133434 RepID=A0A8B8A109_ACAPL|nr:uncharacterized protein LOC110989451 [Acanthaster planci]
MLHSKYFAYLGCISPIYTDISYNSFVVVDRCPPGWFIGTTRNRCENITLSRQEKHLTLFVNGPGDVVFKNVYCAICHGIEEEQLHSWVAELWECQPAAGETVPVEDGGEPDYNTCSEFRVHPPASMPYDPHRCYPGIIESCPPNTTAPVEQIQLCETRTSLLFERPGDAVYKNIHCLNCSNGSTGSVNEDNLACRPLSRRIRFDPRLSFTILFDFRLRGVHIVKNTWHGTERISSSPQLLRNCSQWQLYDPFRGVCRDIMCTDGQAPDEASGTCSTEQVEGTSIRLAKFLNDCPKDLKAINGEISKNNSSLWTVEDIKQADTSSGKRRHVSLNIYTNFARAGHIQSSLDLILSNVTDLVDLACNASSLVLVASNQPPNPPKGICEGYRLGNISFADIFFLDGAFNVNISGFVYDQHEFMHETEYVFDVGEAIVTKRESVTLCNPLVGDRGCSPITLYPEDFYRSIDGGALTEKDGGLLFIAGSYWLLPDGTARVCRVEWFHALAYVSYVGSSCSVTGLALALLTYITFPSLRNTPGKIVMNLMGALFVSQVFLMFVADPQSWLCELRGAMLHFSWLAVFSWMSVLACDLAYNLNFNLRPAQQARQGRLQDWKVLKLSIFAWGLPAAIVFSCLMATRFNRSSSIWFQYGGKTCWIVGTFQSVLAFGCPVTLAITLNFAMFGHLMHRMIANNRRLAALRVGQQTKTTILLCLKVKV